MWSVSMRKTQHLTVWWEIRCSAYFHTHYVLHLLQLIHFLGWVENISASVQNIINTLRQRQNGCYFEATICKCVFINNNSLNLYCKFTEYCILWSNWKQNINGLAPDRQQAITRASSDCHLCHHMTSPGLSKLIIYIKQTRLNMCIKTKIFKYIAQTCYHVVQYNTML